MKKYKNRYGEEYTFTELENGNILWKGNFEHCRFGHPNSYFWAYEKFIEDGNMGRMHLSQFKEQVHKVIYDKLGNYVEGADIARDYGHLVEANTNIINMVDPSGGPYMKSGMELDFIGFPGKRVQEFKNVEDGWEIIVFLADNNTI